MNRRTVWFDLENTPHVLFFEPVIHRLKKAGVEVLVTAKPQSQTLELADARGLEYETVGEGDHRGRVRKLLYGIGRAMMLAAWAGRRRPDLLVSSSRSACVAARWLGLPAIGLLDYEHAEHRPFTLACKPVLLPDLLRGASLSAPLRAAASYFEGLKENLYIDGAGLGRASARALLELASDDFVVVARPPALHAHYAVNVQESAALWARIVRDLHDKDGAILYLLPRDRQQRDWLDEGFAFHDRCHVVQSVLDGPTLVAAADLVVSAGGTMNREAAVLGVPAWSVFTGPAPHLDECLCREGRLTWVRTAEEYEEARDGGGRPPLLARRGPYPLGLARIIDVVRGTLEGEPLEVEVPARISG